MLGVLNMADFARSRRGVNMVDKRTSCRPSFQLTIIFYQKPFIPPLRAIFLLTFYVKYVSEIKSFGHERAKSYGVLPLIMLLQPSFLHLTGKHQWDSGSKNHEVSPNRSPSHSSFVICHPSPLLNQCSLSLQ